MDDKAGLRSEQAIIEQISDKIFGLPGLFNVSGTTPRFNDDDDKMTARTLIMRPAGRHYPGRPGHETTAALGEFLERELAKPDDPEGFLKVSRVDVVGNSISGRVLEPGEKVPEGLEDEHTVAIAIDSNDMLALQKRMDALAKSMLPVIREEPAEARNGAPGSGWTGRG